MMKTGIRLIDIWKDQNYHKSDVHQQIDLNN